MDWMMNNAEIIISSLCVGIAAGIAIVKFFRMPTDAQLNKVKEWCIYAVSYAEKREMLQSNKAVKEYIESGE